VIFVSQANCIRDFAVEPFDRFPRRYVRPRIRPESNAERDDGDQEYRDE
jgi:hypothetical protein